MIFNNRRVLNVFVVLLFAVTLTGCSNGSSTQTKSESQQRVEEVGFDLDDTLLFSTPAFNHAFDQEVKPFSDQFWSIVNASDAGHSCLKPRTINLLEKHRDKGREIFVITAREPHNTGPVKKYLNERFDIPKDHVFFEPDGKTERLKELGIDIYYGDSDSDIKDAKEAEIKAIRVQRSPQSSYDKKYHPGKFDETIIENSASHQCS